MHVGYRHCTLAQLDHFGFKSSSRQDARCGELSIEIYFYGVFSAVVRLPFWAILTLVFMFISVSGLLARRSDEMRKWSQYRVKYQVDWEKEDGLRGEPFCRIC